MYGSEYEYVGTDGRMVDKYFVLFLFLINFFINFTINN